MATMIKTKRTAIEKIERHAKAIAGGKAKVHPGQPFRFSEAAQSGDGVWQGDLGICLIEIIPGGHEETKNPSIQLVPGNTEGAKHCLDSLQGVTMYYPKGWPQSAETDYLGPILSLTEERTILHPKHGPVSIPAGSIVQCTFQREFHAETQRSRRNAD